MNATSQPGLPWRVLTAWGNLRGSIRSLVDCELTEARLVVIAMLSGLIWYLQTVMLFRLGATGADLVGDEVTAFFAAQFIVAIFFRTLMLYGVAGLFGLVLRKRGGEGSWIETRAAVFWAFLVTAPVRLVLMLLSTAVAAEMSPTAGLAIGQAGQLLLVIVLSIFLAEVHKMKAWTIFAGIAAISLVAVLLSGLLPGAS
ncbi:MAG: hypothetical protein AAGE80_16010 [Pseudomonadota bacterium]